ncbi:MAG TPA: hypothetical protein VMZ69_02025 [Saprospiraceae bacterium]|nr:hypothetical protein [Saprospiraceae bacterium]
MELEELKQSWDQTKIKKLKNTDIMELIQHQSNGPLAALKSAFIRQMRIMAIIPLMLLATNLNNITGVLTSIMFWSYVAFCIAWIISFYRNYLLVARMQRMDETVKGNIETQINIIERRLQQNLIYVRIAMIFFIVLAEVVPYIQYYRSLDLWHSIHPVIRFSVYAALLIIQYYASRRVSQHKFGNHLARLKEMVSDMQ